jgi:hypothetical protein
MPAPHPRFPGDPQSRPTLARKIPATVHQRGKAIENPHVPGVILDAAFRLARDIQSVEAGTGSKLWRSPRWDAQDREFREEDVKREHGRFATQEGTAEAHKEDWSREDWSAIGETGAARVPMRPFDPETGRFAPEPEHKEFEAPERERQPESAARIWQAGASPFEPPPRPRHPGKALAHGVQALGAGFKEAAKGIYGRTGKGTQEILKNEYHKAGSPYRKGMAGKISAFVHELPELAKHQATRHAEQWKDAARTLRKVTQGEDLNEAEKDNFRTIVYKVLFATGKMALAGAIAGSITGTPVTPALFAIAFGTGILKGAIREHLVDTAAGAAKFFGSDAALQDADIALLQNFFRHLADEVENLDFSDDEAERLLKQAEAKLAKEDTVSAKDAGWSSPRWDGTQDWSSDWRPPGWDEEAEDAEMEQQRDRDGRFTSGGAAHPSIVERALNKLAGIKEQHGDPAKELGRRMSRQLRQELGAKRAAAMGLMRDNKPAGWTSPQFDQMATIPSSGSSPPAKRAPENHRWQAPSFDRPYRMTLDRARTIARDQARQIISQDSNIVSRASLTRFANVARPVILAMDRMPLALRRTQDRITIVLAMDQTMRSFSPDGHMHVQDSVISRASVNPYWGKEIPSSDELGLDPKQKYWLLRHPDELARAAKTFDNLPILIEHKPISADAHPSELVIGSTGTDAHYQHPFLRNSLVFWQKPAIDAIQNGEQKELSCAYHYVPQMTPGVYEGKHYDGVMTNIVGNHVALVPEGRVGAIAAVPE